MNKPFDVTDLISKSEGAVKPTAEAAAKAETQAVFAWLEESVKLLNPAIAAIAVPVLEQLKGIVLAAEDKIDSVSGN